MATPVPTAIGLNTAFNPQGSTKKYYLSQPSKEEHNLNQQMSALVKYIIHAKSSGKITDDQFRSLIAITISSFIEVELENRVKSTMNKQLDNLIKAL